MSYIFGHSGKSFLRNPSPAAGVVCCCCWCVLLQFELDLLELLLNVAVQCIPAQP